MNKTNVPNEYSVIVAILTLVTILASVEVPSSFIHVNDLAFRNPFTHLLIPTQAHTADRNIRKYS